jgi:RHS repeat-associated protein
MFNPRGGAVAPDGSFYFADSGNDRVRRVGTDGIITTVAGSGTRGFSGDGGPATQANLGAPFDVAVAPDGSFYIVDSQNNRIRRVSPDGIITSVAGGGSSSPGDGGPATQASLSLFISGGVAVGPDGSFFIADPIDNRIRRVGPNGIITTVAGTGNGGFSGDGGLATQANLGSPTGVAVAPDGSIYIAEQSSRVRRVGPDGIITTVAGTGTQGFSGDGGLATQANLFFSQSMAVAPDGSFYIGDYQNNRIRRVASAMPGFSTSDLAIPSPDGNELYRFNGSGRHLQTLNALTGAVRYQFTYDSGGRLTGVTDGDGKIATIERDASGNPAAIVAPGGQRTTLAVNGSGYLSRIANPAGEAKQFSYATDGLLTSETDAKGNLHRFTYDALGRLIRDEDPAGGVKTLSRIETATGHEVTLTTALGRVSTYSVESLPTGEIRRVNSDRAGALTTVLSNPNGTTTVTSPDGTRTTVQRGPDPRFGMLAPVPTTVTHTSPSGRTMTQTTQRTVTLADPTNPLSLQTLTETLTINGRTFTSQYVAATRTMTTTSPEGRQHIAVIDAQGRVISKQLAPGLAPIIFSYDALGRITQAAQGDQGFTYTYDGAHRIVSRVDASGRRTNYAYDTADRVTQVTLPSGHLFGFTYDANGNRTQIGMPNGASHAFSHNSVDREASYTPPDNASYLRSYNVDRALTRSTLPGGRAVDASYDSAGRDIGFSYPEAAIAFGYASGDATDRVNRITRTPVAIGSSEELVFNYDGAQPTSATWSGAAQGQFTYTYDNNFFLTAMQLVSSTDKVQTSFVHDREGLITGYGPFTLTRGGPAGALSQISDGALATTFSYDTMGRLSGRVQNVGGQQSFQAQLTYDVVGQITRKVETVAGITHTYDYSYDADGQLTQISRDGAVIESYSYDANGNRISRQLGDNPVEAASYDAQDRLIQQGAAAYQFDSDGFLTQRASDTFLYSARGELLRATVGGQTVTYSYDGIGRRVSRTTSAGTTQYFYGDPGNAFLLTAVRDPAGVLSTLFYDEAGLLFALERGGSRFYVATDQVGTPRLVTNSARQVLKAIEFDGFGTPVSDSNPSFDLPIGFGGGLTDPVTGLVRFGLRDYDPTAGRWTARDPIRFAGGQGNLFGYVNNNPVNLRDPLGLFCIGASAYLLIGGGAEICYDDGDFSVCGELGFGVGAKAQLNSGGVADNGSELFSEAKAKCGPLGLGVRASVDDEGCVNVKLKAELGSLTADTGKVGVKKKLDSDSSASPGCGIQGKFGFKVCGGTK